MSEFISSVRRTSPTQWVLIALVVIFVVVWQREVELRAALEQQISLQEMFASQPPLPPT